LPPVHRTHAVRARAFRRSRDDHTEPGAARLGRQVGRIRLMTHRNLDGDSQMQATKNYVRQDEHGVRRVGTTRVMLDSVVAAFGQDPPAKPIAQKSPALSREEVYGAIAYSRANKHGADQSRSRQDAVGKQGREKSDAAPSPAAQRLHRQSAKTEADLP